MLDKVLATAFDGCGIPYVSLPRIPRYQELLAAEKKLLNDPPQDPSLRNALRIGVIRLSMYLAESGKEILDAGARAKARVKDGPVIARHDPELRAKLRFLGEALIRRAEKKLPREIRALAKGWQSADALGQLKIAHQLSEILNTPGTRSLLATFHDPRNEVFLPRYFSLRKRRKAITPNCVGKSQLLAAFAHLAGAEAMAVMPIATNVTFYRIFSGRAVLQIMQQSLARIPKLLPPGFEMEGDLPNDSFWRELHGWVDSCFEHMRLPPWIHIALALKMRDGNWVLLDPNLSAVCVLPDTAEVESAHEKLKLLSGVQPGVTFQAEYRNLSDWFHDQIKRLQDARRAMMQYIRAVRTGGRGLTNAAKAVAENPFCEELFKLMRIEDDKLAQSTRLGACRAFLSGKWKLELEDLSELGPARPTEFRRYLAERPSIRWRIATIPYWIMLTAVRELAQAWKVMQVALPHPSVEFANLEHSIATTVVGHIGVNENSLTETEVALSEETSSSFRLHNQILLPLKEGGRYRSHAVRAARALNRLVRIPVGTDGVLNRLSELMQKGPEEGVTDGDQRAPEGAAQEGDRPPVGGQVERGDPGSGPDAPGGPRLSPVGYAAGEGWSGAGA